MVLAGSFWDSRSFASIRGFSAAVNALVLSEAQDRGARGGMIRKFLAELPRDPQGVGLRFVRLEEFRERIHLLLGRQPLSGFEPAQESEIEPRLLSNIAQHERAPFPEGAKPFGERGR